MAPASRTMWTSFRVVEPRTIESSTKTTLFPLRLSGIGFSLSLIPRSRRLWLGSMKVRPI